MKKIEELTLSEIAAEMRTYKFQKEKGYAFVSYSHQNRDKVYPQVLAWMRAGWNIYIDLDFERHGSDSNWVDLMTGTLARLMCRLGICFRSTDYTYSYAALLELLVMRGNIANDRHRGKMSIDSIALEPIPADDEIPSQMRERYEAVFRRMRLEMGDTFLTRNEREREVLRKGLQEWLDDPAAKAIRTSTAEELMSNLDDAYTDGYQEFFPYIAHLIKDWFRSQDLNGNDYSSDSGVEVRSARFQEVHVERVRAPVEGGIWVPVLETGTEMRSSVSSEELPAVDIQGSPYERPDTFRAGGGESGGTIPDIVTFFDMYCITDAKDLRILDRWKRKDPSRTLSVPVGKGADGECVSFDIH